MAKAAQCDVCGKHAPCVSGPMMVTGMETYACCECRMIDPWTKGPRCDDCAANELDAQTHPPLTEDEK